MPNQANDAGIPDPIDLPCQCSDADPRDEKTGQVTFSCYFQRHFSSCNDPSYFDANAELAPEGFCQMVRRPRFGQGAAAVWWAG